MLPSAQKYLNSGGLSSEAAAYVTIGCFLGGVVGIQIVSRLLHQFIPSHVVDCDHSHDEDESDVGSHEAEHEHFKSHQRNGGVSENTPLLPQGNLDRKPGFEHRSRSATIETMQQPHAPSVIGNSDGRPTLQTRLSTLVSGAKSSCDQGGPCFGYSEPCSQDCFEVVGRNHARAFGRFSVSGPPRQPSLLRTATTPHANPTPGRLGAFDEEIAQVPSTTTFSRRPAASETRASANTTLQGRNGYQDIAPSHLNTETNADDVANDFANGKKRDASVESVASTANDPSHHHHVPTNAFLAIGLQTSIAIALHKLPEGFITYATNHANPKLGFSVFMALFIHNITEGFAMALPLYLAINSRWKAMFWSSLLGGISQPLGAGVAALWFKIAGRGDMAPGDTVYGCMFSITAGIMASVALQLFSESLSLTHSRNLCIAFAFIGMGILGVSYALTAG